MIVEMRSYTLKSGAVATVEKRFEQALPARTRLSPLAGLWHTEVGVLNQVIALWPYESSAERERIRTEAAKIPGWPPDIGEFVVEQESKILAPAPFSPKLEPRRLGNIYEIRIYNLPPGGIPAMIKGWSEIIDERVKYSPLVAALYSEQGSTHEWVHIWAYQDAGERERIRAAAVKAGIWPLSVVDARLKRPPSVVTLRMQNMLVIPAGFSPLN